MRGYFKRPAIPSNVPIIQVSNFRGENVIVNERGTHPQMYSRTPLTATFYNESGSYVMLFEFDPVKVAYINERARTMTQEQKEVLWILAREWHGTPVELIDAAMGLA